MFQPLIYVYIQQVKKFVNEIPETVLSLVNIFGDSTKSYDERFQAAAPVVLLTPFFNSELAMRVFTISIQIVNSYLNEKHELPLKFLQNFELLRVDHMNKETTEKAIEFMKEQMKSELKASTIIVFAPLSHDLIEEYDQEEYFSHVMQENITSDRNSQLASCFLIEFLADHYHHEPTSAPDATILINQMMPLIISTDDEVLRVRATKAFRALIDAHVFGFPEIVKQIIDQFNQFPDKKLFFKILNKYVIPGGCDCEEENEEEEDPIKDEIITIVQQFLLNHINNNENELIQAYCIETLADLAGTNQKYVEGCYMDVIQTAKRFIEKNSITTFTHLSCFFVAMVRCFSEQTVSIIKPLLPQLCTILGNDSICSKDQINLACDIAQIVHDGYADDLVDKLATFATKQLCSCNLKDILHSCAIIIPLTKKFTPEQAIPMFTKLTEYVKTTTVPEELVMLITTIRKFFKAPYELNEKIVTPFINDLMNGNLSALDGQPPYMQQPAEDCYFELFATFFKRSPSQSAQFAEQMIFWLNNTPFSGIHLILAPLMIAIENGSVGFEGCKQLANVLKSDILKKLEKDDSAELMSVADVLSSINQKYPEALNPVTHFIDKFAQMLKPTSQNNEEEEEDELENEMDALESIPLISKFIFEVYNSNPNVPVNEDIVRTILGMMPFDAEDGMGEIINLLNEMLLQESDRFDFMHFSVGVIYANILLLKKEELEEFGIPEEDLEGMKTVLKLIVKGNKKMENEIKKSFGKSKAKINRFMQFIK